MTPDEKKRPALRNPDNYFFVASEDAFMYLPTRTLMKRDAVKRQLGGEAAFLVERERAVSNLFWSPNMPTLLENCAVVDDALIAFEGNFLLNTYQPPNLKQTGDPLRASFWLELGKFLYGDDFDHIVKCLAFKIQNPGVKINHCLVMGSFDQGIGKDSLLEPVIMGVGANNFNNCTAALAVEWNEKGFNERILQKVITRISEVHDLGPARFKFYQTTKDWHAAPPNTLTVANKHVKPHSIANVVLPIFTTNHKTDGVHIEPDDRRHFVAWSPRTYQDFETDQWRNYWKEYGYEIPPAPDGAKDEYWRGYYMHLQAGGSADVVAYLSQPGLIAGFSPGARPPKTAAWYQIVAAGKNPDDAELLDVLDRLGEMVKPFPDFSQPVALNDGRPDALTIDMIMRTPGCPSALANYFSDPKHSRAITHRLESARYVSVDNPDRQDGYWRVNGKRCVVYVKREFSAAEAIEAATALAAKGTGLTVEQDDFAEVES